MCAEHHNHRTGNCAECRKPTVALSNGRSVPLDDYFAGDYGTKPPLSMPQLWEGDQA